jgi:hypothetical protein
MPVGRNKKRIARMKCQTLCTGEHAQNKWGIVSSIPMSQTEQLVLILGDTIFRHEFTATERWAIFQMRPASFLTRSLSQTSHHWKEKSGRRMEDHLVDASWEVGANPAGTLSLSWSCNQEG